jgi:hypothetical protein
MATTFARRQFNTVPTESWPVTVNPASGSYFISGSESVLLINFVRQNLAQDNLYGAEWGWFPSPDLTAKGIIVQGNDAQVNNTRASGGAAYISFWGWDDQETQNANDDAFISLAQYVLNTSEDELETLKLSLVSKGYYYQYPVGYNGQSPNTGTGSDVL